MMRIPARHDENIGPSHDDVGSNYHYNFVHLVSPFTQIIDELIYIIMKMMIIVLILMIMMIMMIFVILENIFTNVYEQVDDLNAYLDIALTTKFEDLDIDWTTVCKVCRKETQFLRECIHL